MIVKICRIFDKKDGTLHIGGVVWRFFLVFMWLVLSCNLGLLIGKMSSKNIAEYLSKKLEISKKIIYQKVINFNE